MEIKQLKASLQLAQMRLNSDPSEANQAKYDQAKQAYELAQKPESQKFEQVSGESGNSGVPEDTAKTGDVAGSTETSEIKAENSGNLEKSEPPAADPAPISAPPVTDTPNEAVPAANDEQKKTDDLAAPQE